jgi:molybdopterin molybdotransferase
MIAFQEALALISESVKPLVPRETVFNDTLGRVLAEDIASSVDMPLFDNSAMDGFAVIAGEVAQAGEESPVLLDIIEDIFAGSIPHKAVNPGHASRIMTGAPLPDGADSVVIKENTMAQSGKIAVLRPLEKGENVRRRGEDFKKGEIILKSGTLMGPAEIGICATTGKTALKVIPSPRVALLSSGNELVSPEEPLCGSCLRDANSYTLEALVKEWGGEPVALGIARDEKKDIMDKIARGMAQADVLVTAAGISVGEGDLMREALLEMGAQMAFWRVAIRPGKPTAFGTLQGKPLFCLPGNPVSAMITFLQFVRPALLLMRGIRELRLRQVHALADHEVSKKKELRSFLRVTLRKEGGILYASLTGPQGSGNLLSMTRAQGLMVLPESVEKVAKGEEVLVEIFTTQFYKGGVGPWDQ